MEADGSRRVRLTTDAAADSEPSWSPDGGKIAFRSNRGGDADIFVMNADGTSQRQLTDSPGADTMPAWSPNGRRIAFMSARSGENLIWLMDTRGERLRTLSETRGWSPSWSPDGRQIAFHCDFGRVFVVAAPDIEICVAKADGSDVQPITNAEGDSQEPAWSPDGSLIAFQSDRAGWPMDRQPRRYDPERYGDWELYTISPTGAKAERVTIHPQEDDTEPEWSPDGAYLLVNRYGCLTLVSLKSDGAVRLTKGTCADSSPDWVEPSNK
jgi:TolB protein